MDELHKLYRKQLAKTTGADGTIDQARLGALISDAYETADRDRRRVDRANTLMAEELAAATDHLNLLVRTLEIQNRRFEVALDHMAQGLCLFDRHGTLVVCNQRFIAMFGLEGRAPEAGRSLAEILADCPIADAPTAIERHLAHIVAGQRGRWQHVLTDGRVIAVAHEPLPDDGFVETFVDVTERRRAEARIAHMALHDALTDLPNRVLFHEKLAIALDRVAYGEKCAVLCLDLDQFKQVNDTLGHATGDALLRAVTERIRRQVRQVDTVARLGGDEFAIVQTGIEQPADVIILVNRLIEEIELPYEFDGHRVTIGTSIGISLAPSDGTTSDHLLRNADMAMYQAKAAGRGCYRFFKDTMDAALQQRRALELDLRNALHGGEFELYYQPLVNTRERRVTGFEALLRWSRPGFGLIEPAAFIGLAEETGLIVPIGAWVLQQACAEATKWPAGLKVAVNLSPLQFRGDELVQTVSNALARAGLAPTRLELEVTDLIMIRDPVATLDTLHQLQDMGICISMDDFGTGWSLISQLRSFPFDKVKIDRSFIKELGTRPDSIAIIRAFTAICDSLGIATTAAGAETREQLAILDDERCIEVQGYFFSKPKPARDIPSLLATLGADLAVPEGVEAG